MPKNNILPGLLVTATYYEFYYYLSIQLLLMRLLKIDVGVYYVQMLTKLDVMDQTTTSSTMTSSNTTDSKYIFGKFYFLLKPDFCPGTYIDVCIDLCFLFVEPYSNVCKCQGQGVSCRLVLYKAVCSIHHGC